MELLADLLLLERGKKVTCKEVVGYVGVAGNMKYLFILFFFVTRRGEVGRRRDELLGQGLIRG